jgi:hypothetical protein
MCVPISQVMPQDYPGWRREANSPVVVEGGADPVAIGPQTFRYPASTEVSPAHLFPHRVTRSMFTHYFQKSST